MWPGSIPAWYLMWVEFVVDSRLAPRVFLLLQFSSLHETQRSKFQFDQGRGPACKPAKAGVALFLTYLFMLWRQYVSWNSAASNSSVTNQGQNDPSCNGRTMSTALANGLHCNKEMIQYPLQCAWPACLLSLQQESYAVHTKGVVPASILEVPILGFYCMIELKSVNQTTCKVCIRTIAVVDSGTQLLWEWSEKLQWQSVTLTHL